MSSLTESIRSWQVEPCPPTGQVTRLHRRSNTLDPTGFAKKGTKSAGVQRQYSGTLGRIDNCQIGTFLAYVNTNRDRVLIDRELYIPEGSWFGDPDRCAEAAIPADLTFKTRPQQVMAMIERARWSDLTFAWFTADEEFGQNPGLRDYLEEAEISYVNHISLVDTRRSDIMVGDLPTLTSTNESEASAVSAVGTSQHFTFRNNDGVDYARLHIVSEQVVSESDC